MIEFELNNHEYITLNNLLKFMGFVQTGGEANQTIENGEVKVNNSVETQKRKKLRVGDKVQYLNKEVLIKK
jgi:ribosome-associated protein